MKNFILFLTLISLLLFVYFYEEVHVNKIKAVEDNKHKIFDEKKLGAMKGLKTRNAEIVKGLGKFYTSKNHIQVDEDSLNEVFYVLSRIKIKRFFTEEEIKEKKREDYFPSGEKNKITFFFEAGKLDFVLGKKLDFDQTFYMEITNKEKKMWVVAFDSSANPEVYNLAEAHNHSGKYNRIMAVLNLDESFYYDRHVFVSKLRSKSSDVWNEIKISNTSGISFSVNFNNRTTVPAVFTGLSYFSTYFTEMIGQFLRMKGKKLVLNYRKKDLREEIASLYFTDLQGITQKLKLYRLYKKHPGFFLVSDTNQYLYELDKRTSDLFFLTVQDFWDKRIFSLNPSVNDQDLFFKIKFNNISSSLKIPVDKKFKVNRIAGTDIPKEEEFRKLITFLKASVADRVTLVTDTFREQLQLIPFRLMFEGMEIVITHSNDELIVINDTYGYKLHYAIGDKLPFGLKYNDYFFNN